MKYFRSSLTIFTVIMIGVACKKYPHHPHPDEPTIFAGISLGARHQLILKPDGTVWSIGANSYGQLGDGTNIEKHIPTFMTDCVKSIAAGDLHSLMIKNDNRLWVVGHNDFGQLGIGTTTNVNTPVKMMDSVISANGSVWSAFAIKSDHTLWGTSVGASRFGKFDGEKFSTFRSN